MIHILLVSPWGRFCPDFEPDSDALCQRGDGVRVVVDDLQLELFNGDGNDNGGAKMLVVGMVLHGHGYRPGRCGGRALEVELTGCTPPWNMCTL